MATGTFAHSTRRAARFCGSTISTRTLRGSLPCTRSVDANTWHSVRRSTRRSNLATRRSFRGSRKIRVTTCLHCLRREQFMRLQGKRALITGASRGIGRGIAEVFADEGADVAVNYVSHPEKAEEVVKALKGQGRKAMAVA